MVTSQLTMRSKKRSSLAAFSRTIASTAGEGSMFRKLICKGICMLLSFSILKPMPPRSRASLDLVDHVVHTENIPVAPTGMVPLHRPAYGGEVGRLAACNSSMSKRWTSLRATGFQLGRSDFAPLQWLMYRQVRGEAGNGAAD